MWCDVGWCDVGSGGGGAGAGGRTGGHWLKVKGACRQEETAGQLLPPTAGQVTAMVVGMCVSMHPPARLRAGSNASGRLVAPITTTCPRCSACCCCCCRSWPPPPGSSPPPPAAAAAAAAAASSPAAAAAGDTAPTAAAAAGAARSSMHVSICATMRCSIWRCAVSRFGAMASISSMKMMLGATSTASYRCSSSRGCVLCCLLLAALSLIWVMLGATPTVSLFVWVLVGGVGWGGGGKTRVDCGWVTRGELKHVTGCMWRVGSATTSRITESSTAMQQL